MYVGHPPGPHPVQKWTTFFRLTAEGLRDVEQKDIQVRLQELFRDRKLELENTIKNMETHYEHILQVSETQNH